MGGMALVMGLSGSFEFLAKASTVVRLLGYIICIAALPLIRRRASATQLEQAYRIPGGYLIPAIGLAICFWMLYYAPAESWLAVGILLAIGFVLYAGAKSAAR